MRLRTAIFVVLLCASLGMLAQDSNTLRAIAQDVYRQRHQRNAHHEQTIAQLQAHGKLLDDVMKRGTLSPQENAAAYYYRASIAAQINSLHYSDGKKMDEVLARQALADLDKVIAGGLEYPELGVSNREAQYMAGSVAKIQLRANTLGYSYWEKCADLGHAGCLNIMANTRLTGEGGQKMDFREAIEYHLKVFNTGIEYRCAGVYSAQSIAAIIYFTGTAASQGDELAWLQKAYGLLDKLAARDQTARVCGRSDLLIDEFLYRLARGQRLEKLLSEVSEQLERDSNTTQTVIGLLSDQLTPTGFVAAASMAKTDPAKCSAYFDALWYAELTKRHDLAQQYYQDILNLGPSTCSVELVYARKFNFAPQAKSDSL